MENDPKFTALFNTDGKISRWPAKRKYQVMLVNHLQTKMPQTGEYSEKEINEIIKNQITLEDFVMLRRELVDSGALNRTPDGRIYTPNAEFVAMVL